MSGFYFQVVGFDVDVDRQECSLEKLYQLLIDGESVQFVRRSGQIRIDLVAQSKDQREGDSRLTFAGFTSLYAWLMERR
jgi:hypothetical protein